MFSDFTYKIITVSYSHSSWKIWRLTHQLLVVAVSITCVVDIAVPVRTVRIDIAIRISIGIEAIGRAVEVVGQTEQNSLII